MIPDNQKLLLCSDLDRTLIPNGAALEDPEARRVFRKLCGHPGLTLVYVTGRHQQLVREALEAYELPRPDYTITDVGSTIYKVTDDSWRQLVSWKDQLRTEWPEGTDQRIRTLLDRVSGPTLQEEAKQNFFKISYYVPLHLNEDNILRHIDKLLQKAQIPAQLIWSIDEVAEIGLLDILPAGADKRQAIRFLQQHLHCPDDELLFAGDSGNDLQVINSDIRSILVANAAPEIKQSALAWAQTNDRMDSLYIAKGDILPLNGNYSAGVLEGVCYYQPALQAYL